MGDVQRYPVPQGYNRKAYSQGFNGAEAVAIYYSEIDDEYLIVVEQQLNEDVVERGHYVTKSQLALIVHAGTDVLEMAAQ